MSYYTARGWLDHDGRVMPLRLRDEEFYLPVFVTPCASTCPPANLAGRPSAAPLQAAQRGAVTEKMLQALGLWEYSLVALSPLNTARFESGGTAGDGSGCGDVKGGGGGREDGGEEDGEAMTLEVEGKKREDAWLLRALEMGV